MTIGITFPVHETSHDVEGCPKSIPWAVIEALRPLVIMNHHQTPERLYARGGLDLQELAALIKGERSVEDRDRSDADALAIVQQAVGTGKRAASGSEK
jgi:hypothetical protein